MSENAKSDGYKFAVTFLVAITSIIYAFFNYFQNAAVDLYFYIIICFFYSTGIVTAVGFLIYILIKGFLMEVKNQNIIDYLNKIANQIYKWSIISFIIILQYTLAIFITYIIRLDSPLAFIPILVVVFAPFLYILYRTPKLRITKYLFGEEYPIFFGILIVWTIVGIVILLSPLNGQIIVEMKDINYKSDSEIPVTIQVTGPDTGIKLTLVRYESNNLFEVANISLIRPILIDSNKEKFVYNDYFTANSRDIGKYKIFINTAKMTTGYYELWSTRPIYEKTSEKEGFYLLNKS